MNRRGFDMIYLDLAGFAEFMKADNEDNGKAPEVARAGEVSEWGQAQIIPRWEALQAAQTLARLGDDAE